MGSNSPCTLKRGFAVFSGFDRTAACSDHFRLGLSLPHNTSKDGSHCCFPFLPGYIKNTEKLNYGKEHQYKLTVTAYDCGKKRATEDVLVKISVKPTCSPGWQGELPSLSLLCLFCNERTMEKRGGELPFSLSHPSMGQRRLEQQNRV